MLVRTRSSRKHRKDKKNDGCEWSARFRYGNVARDQCLQIDLFSEPKETALRGGTERKRTRRKHL